MCGIAGFMLLDARSTDLPGPDMLARMSDTLVHRGPDTDGTWHNPSRGIGLAHRRLSIRDLSPSGNQPMTSRCGRYVIVYNGEVYSHEELARDLVGAGRALRGTSDTEVILEAFAEWGVEAVLPRMIGMFAFALFDKESGELVLARDRLGIKPLYWGVIDGLMMFGSELKPLRALNGWVPRLDRDALAGFMRHNYIPAPHTIYRDVKKLEPGTLLRCRSGRDPEVLRYWDLRVLAEASLRNGSNQSEAEALDELDTLLHDTVRRRMVADVPLGALLSGGIDSSLVTAMMVESSNRPINTYSIGFRDKAFDEAPYARAIAEHLGTHHTELYVEPDDAIGLVEQLPYWYDEPFADSSQIPTALVFELTRREVTVVLSGDGGDELFAGYSRYGIALEAWRKTAGSNNGMYRMIARAVLAQPRRRLDALNRVLPPRYRRNQLGAKLHGMAQAILGDDPDVMYRQMISHWHEPDDVVLGAQEPKGVLWDEGVRSGFPGLLERMQFLDTVTYLPDDILTKVDRASMRVSLEARVPLLDHRLVERAWSLPQRMKMRDGETKWALRQLLYRRVPRALIERPKMGFGVPIADWMRGPLRDWAEALLAPDRLEDQGLFAPEPIRERWEAHLAGTNWGYPLWNVLMAQAWIEANPDVVL